MSLSKQERLENLDLAITLMMSELGEQDVCSVYFDIDGNSSKNIFPTTWQQLENDGYIERHDTLTSNGCRLTGSGWLEGLKLTGKLGDPELTVQIGRIMAALKTSIDGRNAPAFVSPESIAEQADVSYGLVFNVIDSRFIYIILNRHDADWEGQRGNIIKVPIDFGLEPL